MTIPCYVINLKSRYDRRVNIEKEFINRHEFAVRILAAHENSIGAIGLWETIKQIIYRADNSNHEYILICEDDHQFTTHYNFQLLQECILEAQSLDADILLGGVSWFDAGVLISDHLFWIKKFSGLQFTKIFKRFYPRILEADFAAHDAADYKISELTDKKFAIHPFLSTQKDFGYSDVTPKNNGSNRVEELFATSENNISIIKKISSFYKNIQAPLNQAVSTDFDAIILPTYIIHLPERTERREHIVTQFRGKKEFDITIMDAVKHEIGAVALWKSIRSVIQMAIVNDDDVIVICEDDHEFTEHYNRDILIQNILEAHAQGCDILSAGIGGFNHAVPITANRYWMSSFLCTQFIVVYKKFFKAILNEPFDDKVTADDKISEMTSHKMVIYPFMSVQREFGYSDITSNNNGGKISIFFEEADKRLGVYQNAFTEYLNNHNNISGKIPLAFK